MGTREKIAALLILVMALGVWCCVLGFGAVARGSDPLVWWSMLLLLVVGPAVSLAVLMRSWRRPPKT
jgi:hypothetical protein